MKKSVWTLCGLVLLASFPLKAAVVKGPYLQDVRSDSIVVLVETDVNQTCVVEWGEGLSQSQTLEADGLHQEGRVSGLSPSTCFPYRVRCGTETTPQASFCTAALPGEAFRFVLFGDTRSNHDIHRQVAERIRAERPDFFINSGDLVSNGENEEDWVPFFEAEADLLREVPMYPVVGNHDEEDGVLDRYQRLFAPPTESSGSERHYAFSYGNARFVVLDNQSSVLLAQKSWFEEVLDEAAADPAVEHLFVILHENMYSSKDGRSGDWYFRSWRNLMKDKGVNMVFAGHDHYYERGEADNGLPYIIAGGGAAGLYDTENPTEGDPIDIFYPAHRIWYSRSVNHYICIDIHGPHLNACTKDSQGVAFDCFSYGEMPDAGMPDAGEEDAGEEDAGEEDAGIADAGDVQDGGLDGGVSDAGEIDGADDGGGQAADTGSACDCSGQAEDLVCGEDGVTYDNLCVLDCAQVGMRHHGACEEDADPCDCPDLDEPVCGQDGVTYRNPCVMICMGVEGEHEGPCSQDGCACGRGMGFSGLGFLLIGLFWLRMRLRLTGLRFKV